MTRQIVLDTETTGLEVSQGHRIIEIGCVELVNRRLTGRDFWEYINPDREIEEGASAVHNITNEDLQDKPFFGDIVQRLLDYIDGAELIIHNAEFDVGFLDAELERARSPRRISDLCTVTDTLLMAREQHPGQRNSLDALCKRYEIDNTRREHHGALLDAQLLADVYLAMTGGQSAIDLAVEDEREASGAHAQLFQVPDGLRPPIVTATADELALHDARVQRIAESSGVTLPWH